MDHALLILQATVLQVTNLVSGETRLTDVTGLWSCYADIQYAKHEHFLKYTRKTL
jgi:hypothetical protein